MSQYDDTAFRALFPEFSDTTKYSSVLLSAYWDVANEFVTQDSAPWAVLSGSNVDFILNLLTAHFLTLGLQNQTAANKGKVGQAQGGFVSSASIGEVSVTKVAPPTTDMFDWWLAQSPYGQQLLAFLEIKAVGGLSVGGMPERQGFRKVYGVFL